MGIRRKWFRHVARARVVARVLRQIDPDLRIVLGGNTASYFWQELMTWDCIDHVVLGDGELPLLALCRGDAAPPNVVSRRADGTVQRAPLGYIQGATRIHPSFESQCGAALAGSALVSLHRSAVYSQSASSKAPPRTGAAWNR